MLKQLAVVALALPFVACSAVPEAAAPVEQRSTFVDPSAARIDAFMQRNVEAGFSGTLLVVKDDRALLEKGYGLRDREKQLPNTPNTVHAIGSITKQFTAAAVLKLAEQGELDVLDTLDMHFAQVPADKASITLHQLLTHSAGFPEVLGDDYAAIERQEFVELALAAPLQFEPGSGYMYTNVGYSLLGAIVEQVSGTSYESFLREELLIPAGCLQTGYVLPDWSRSELAVGYRKDGVRWGTMNEQAWAADGPYWHLRCNGGLMSTARDMYGWVQALAQHTVLGSALVESMFTPHVAEGGDSHYGYGWALVETMRGTRLVTHNGGNGVQFADVLWFADEGVTVVLLSNASARGMQDLAWQVGRMVFDATFEPSVAVAQAHDDVLPDGPQGDRLRALCDVIARGDRASAEVFVKGNLGPGFLSDLPLEEHLRAFEIMQTEIGAHSFEGVQRVGSDEFVLLPRSQATSELYRVLVQLRPSDALISGLGVQADD